MRIAVIGDVHDHQQRLGEVLAWIAGERPDLSLLVGDVGCDPEPEEEDRPADRGAHDVSVHRVVARIRGELRCPVAFVPGNHDLPDPAPDVDAVNCDRQVLELRGLRIAGLGGAGISPFAFPYEWDEPQADQALRGMLDGREPVDVLICHAPPARTGLDRTRRGEHVGSEAVRSWILQARPRLVVCGHIHEAWGVERLSRVPCLNAGGLGEPFGESIGWLVDWSGAGPAGVRSYRRGTDGRVEEREWA